MFLGHYNVLHSCLKSVNVIKTAVWLRPLISAHPWTLLILLSLLVYFQIGQVPCCVYFHDTFALEYSFPCCHFLPPFNRLQHYILPHDIWGNHSSILTFDIQLNLGKYFENTKNKWHLCFTNIPFMTINQRCMVCIGELCSYWLMKRLRPALEAGVGYISPPPPFFS